MTMFIDVYWLYYNHVITPCLMFFLTSPVDAPPAIPGTEDGTWIGGRFSSRPGRCLW